MIFLTGNSKKQTKGLEFWQKQRKVKILIVKKLYMYISTWESSITYPLQICIPILPKKQHRKNLTLRVRAIWIWTHMPLPTVSKPLSLALHIASILWLPDEKSWLIGKDPDAGKDWRQEEKGTTEDKMVGWHHWLNGHESEQTLGDGEGQGRLLCCRPWGRKE